MPSIPEFGSIHKKMAVDSPSGPPSRVGGLFDPSRVLKRIVSIPWIAINLSMGKRGNHRFTFLCLFRRQRSTLSVHRLVSKPLCCKRPGGDRETKIIMRNIHLAVSTLFLGNTEVDSGKWGRGSGVGGRPKTKTQKLNCVEFNF